MFARATQTIVSILLALEVHRKVKNGLVIARKWLVLCVETY